MSDNTKSKNVEAKEKYLMEYQEVGNFIRHCSSVRSAVVSFLITVACAAFAAYFNTPTGFLIFVGHLMIVAALFVCLWFSYWTEKAELYLTKVWKWFDGDGPEPGGFKSFKGGCETSGKVLKDPMNWVLILGVLSIVVAFRIFQC